MKLFATLFPDSPKRSWLSILFPPCLPKAFNLVEDLPEILNYQYRLSRTQGVEPKNATVGARIKHVHEGFYVKTGPPTMLHYTDEERPRVAVYPIRTQAEETEAVNA